MNKKKKRRLAEVVMIIVSFIYVFLNDWQRVEYVLLALPVIIGVLEGTSSDTEEDESEIKDSSYYEKRFYTGELREDLKKQEKESDPDHKDKK